MKRCWAGVQETCGNGTTLVLAACFLLVCASLGLAVAHAAEPQSAPAERAVPPNPRDPAVPMAADILRVTPARDVLLAAGAARASLPAESTEPAPSREATRFKPAMGGVSLIELPPEFSLRGTRRAHHALGFRSHVAENWLKEQGISAHNCMLPMLRLHTRVAPSGAASGTFWVYARCSLR